MIDGEGLAGAKRFRAYQRHDLPEIVRRLQIGEDRSLPMLAVASVFPFRANNYIVEELIEWSQVPNEPIFQLTFPQEGMLEPHDLNAMIQLVSAASSDGEVEAAARRIRARLNPHPGGQMELNVPREDGSLEGIQHKYPETVLFFPAAGQTCHAYCNYCFRWAQFVAVEGGKFSTHDSNRLVQYLLRHPEVTDVLLTGGDPLMMRTAVLRRYIEPLLTTPDLDHLTLRIGTKAPAYWPYRFLTDRDADDLLRLFEEVVQGGRHLAVMAHYSHARELQTDAAQRAVARILATGAVIRSQAPVVRHVNDSASAWGDLWRQQVRLGIVPYYLFVERDTGPRSYFEVPLVTALHIYQDAYRSVSGLARTVRGPVMSTTPGKVLIEGTTEIGSEVVFVLKMIQARVPSWVNRLFFARHDSMATWFDQLQPVARGTSFFYEEAWNGSAHHLSQQP